LRRVYGIRKQLVQLLDHFQAHGFFEFERKEVAHGSIELNFPDVLMKLRLRADLAGRFRINPVFCHLASPFVSVFRKCLVRMQHNQPSPVFAIIVLAAFRVFRSRNCSQVSASIRGHRSSLYSCKT
jgi:hypothetical protein